MKRLLGFTGSTLLLMLIAVSVHADVRDDGSFFSPDALQKANSVAQQLKRDTGKDLLIETYPAIPTDRAQNYSPDNKDAFFREWGKERANRAHIDGVYILLNKNPSYLFITTGDRPNEQLFSRADETDLRNQMLAPLKQKQFDAALSAATDLVSQRIRQNAPAGAARTLPPPSPSGYSPPPIPSGNNAPQYTPPPTPREVSRGPAGGFSVCGILPLLIVGYIVYRIIKGIIRRRMTGFPPGGGGGYPGGGGFGRGGFGGGGFPTGGGGGGFGRGMFGGILGGMMSSWLSNRMSGGSRGNAYGAPPPPPFDPGGGGAGGSFGGSSNDSISYSDGAGGSFDSGGDPGNSGGGGDSGTGGSF